MRSYFVEELLYELRSRWRKWSKPFGQALVSASIAIGSVLLWPTSEGQQLDHWVLRHFFQFRGTRPPPSDVVIVAIDDETYGELAASTNFPLPRRYLADALEAIEAASPKIIILDAKIPAQPNMEPEADNRIEAALKAGPTTIWTGEMPAEESELTSPTSPPPVLSSESRFRKAAKMELPMTVAGEDEMVLYVSYGTAPDATLYERVPIAKALVELAKLNIAKPGPDDLINYYGPKGTFSRVPLFRLLGPDSLSARESLRNKIVLLGYQSLARGRGVINKDEFAVPVSKFEMFGLEIHANIIGNLVDHSWLRQLTRQVERNVLVLLSLLIASVGMRLPAMKGVTAAAVMTGLVILFDYYFFAYRQIWISGIGSFLAATAVTMVAIAFYRIWSTERFRKYMNRVIGFPLEREF